METIVTVFWNREEHRLRAFWRLVVLSIVLIVLVVLLQFIAGLLIGGWLLLQPGTGMDMEMLETQQFEQLLTSPAFLLLGNVGMLFVIVGSIWLVGWLIDRRRFADFGLHMSRGWWLDMAFGLVLGALLMAAIFLVEWSLGWITITGTFQTPLPGQSFALAILLPLIAFLAVGIQEEILARGYLLQNFAEGLKLGFIGPRGAIIIAWLLSSAIFGLLHAANPNATVVSTINLMLAGLFLGLAYVLTGELAIPIGLHITWNFFQGNVFGFPVSGLNAASTTFIAIEQGGPPLWTGGNFGPEAGLIGITAILVGSLMIGLWVRLRYRRVTLYLPLADAPTLSQTGEHDTERDHAADDQRPVQVMH